MDSDLKLGVISALFFLGIVLVFIGINWFIGAGCQAGWRDSGFPVQYSAMGGCRISRDGGRTWIPDDAFKAVEVK